jgi:signal transduction histidine kinase
METRQLTHEAFTARYKNALTAYIRTRDELTLHKGYELGRRALAGNMSILDLASTHHKVLALLMCEAKHLDSNVYFELGERFLIECLSSFEMLQTGNRETNAALRRLNEILESEARRIAHVLHDESAQLLAATYLELAEILNELPPEPIRIRVNRITSHLDQVREQLRRISHELRPPILDQLGLLPALEFLADGYRKRSGLNVTVSGSSDGRFQDTIETALYRAVQEALNNIARHANAHDVIIRVWHDGGSLHCSVQDDGKGFSQPADASTTRARTGLGLLGIQERLRPLYGSLVIESAPGKGTQLSIVIPLGGTA